MNVTFLVEIDLDDITRINDTAQEILEDLSDNHLVLSVKPWARPTAPIPVQPQTNLPVSVQPAPGLQPNPGLQP